MDQKLDDLILKLPEYFVISRSEGINITAQLNLQAEVMDYWTLKIENQKCEISHDKAIQPQLELTAAASDLIAIMTGKLNPTRAYMQGKLNLRGNILQALKLIELFNIPDEILGKIQM